MAEVRLYYVAGPFSAPDRAGVERNIKLAECVGIELAQLGLMPLVPHCNTSAPEFEDAQPYQFWIDGTLELLKRSDVLVTVPGWEQSSGARGEVAWALGETGSWLTRQWYRYKRRVTGVGRRPVFHTPANAHRWELLQRGEAAVLGRRRTTLSGTGEQ